MNPEPQIDSKVYYATRQALLGLVGWDMFEAADDSNRFLRPSTLDYAVDLAATQTRVNMRTQQTVDAETFKDSLDISKAVEKAVPGDPTFPIFL